MQKLIQIRAGYYVALALVAGISAPLLYQQLSQQSIKPMVQTVATHSPAPVPSGHGAHVTATGNPWLDQYEEDNGYVVDTPTPEPTTQVIYSQPRAVHCTTTRYGINDQFASTDCY